MGESGQTDGLRWLMLVHQLPPEPAALRVRVWRRLQALGALQLKSSVYLLPESEAALEDFEWLVAEVRRGGGDATLWRSVVVEGSSDARIIAQFQEAIGGEYEELEREARAFDESPDSGAERARALARMTTRFHDIGAHDHFGAPRREVVGAMLAALQGTGQRRQGPGATEKENYVQEYRGRTWVTRTNVKIDRMTSAWLIRRFVDAQAHFAFTRDKDYAPKEGELRFDMYEGEFTHEGDLCTFEVLLRRFGLTDPGLTRLAEIVHDVDLKENRYAHPETAGIAAVLGGLVERIPDDLARIEAASTMLDGLVEQLRTAAVRA